MAVAKSALVRFQPIKLAARQAAEDACLCIVNHALVTVLVRLTEDVDASAPRWYLEAGFGPCEGEGLIFPNLADAERWILDKLSGPGPVDLSIVS